MRLYFKIWYSHVSTRISPCFVLVTADPWGPGRRHPPPPGPGQSPPPLPPWSDRGPSDPDGDPRTQMGPPTQTETPLRPGRRSPLWTEWLTDKCKRITLPQTSFANGKIPMRRNIFNFKWSHSYTLSGGKMVHFNILGWLVCVIYNIQVHWVLATIS